MIFSKIGSAGDSLVCDSTMRYLSSEPLDRKKYTIARFCPMSQLDVSLQPLYSNYVTVITKLPDSVTVTNIMGIIGSNHVEN